MGDRIVNLIADQRQKRDEKPGPIGAGARGLIPGLAAAGLFALALIPLGQVVVALGVVGEGNNP